MGAGLVPGSVYPETFWFLFDAWAGGRNWKKEVRQGHTSPVSDVIGQALH
jgi:hypothetical protein